MSPKARRSAEWKPADGRSAPASSRSKRTREQVLSAAIEVFGNKGFNGATMLDIAQQAGVASGTAYQYFADKADVFRYLLQDLEDQLHRETRMPGGGDGRLVVREAVLRYLSVYRAHDALFRTWWEVLEPHTEFTDAWVALHEKSRREISAVIDDGKRRGIVDEEVDSAITADLMVSLFERPAYLRIVFGWDDNLSDAEVAEVMAALLGHGLFEPPPPAAEPAGDGQPVDA
jgi:AcrR family transcriptional regulator